MAEEDQTTQTETVEQQTAAQDDSSQSTQAAEVQTQGDEQATSQETETAQTQATATEQQPSRRMNERFREIYEKGLKDGQQQSQSTPNWLQALQAQQPQRPQAPDFDEPETYTKQEVNALLANTQLAQETKEARREAANRFQDEVRQVEAKHPKYRPGSSDFDPDAYNAAWELYQPFAEQIVANPFAKVPSFDGFIDKLEAAASREQAKAQARTKAVLDEQASQAALPSNAFSATDRSFESLSKTEKEKKLGFVE